MNKKQTRIRKEILWNQWFAGLVDGDGYFYKNKSHEISFELTTHITDIRLCYNIKNKLKAGSIKIRGGQNSTRYRVKQRDCILNIINRLNGKLQHPTRLKQFMLCCSILNVKFIVPPLKIDRESGYLAGLIDSDGTLTICVSKTNQVNSQLSGLHGKIKRLEQSRGYNQIQVKITSISKHLLSTIQKSYDVGVIYAEKPNKKNKSPNYKYHWTLTSKPEFFWLSEYLRKIPLKSVKMHRMRLIKYYFYYKQLGYNLRGSSTLEYKIWCKFCKSWFKYTI